MKIEKIFLVLILALIPYIVFAQSAKEEFNAGNDPSNRGETIDPTGNDTTVDESNLGSDIDPANPNAVRPNDGKLDLPVAPASRAEKVKLSVITKRAGTNRILGQVKINLSDGAKSLDEETSDPPSPTGEQLFEADPGKYKIRANRIGYKKFEKDFQISKGKDVTLNISMMPETYVPDPLREYQAKIMAMMYAASVGQNNQGFPYPGQSPWQSQAPFNNTGYYNTQTNQYNTYPPYSQNGYILSADQTATIPIVIKMQIYGLINTNRSINVSLIEPLTGNAVTLASSGPVYYNASFSANNNNIYRSGCIKPNTGYILRVSNNQPIGYAGQPYQDTPINPTQDGYVEVNIQPPNSLNYGGSSFANIYVQNQPAQFGMYQLGINCPTGYNSTTQTSSWPVPGGYSPSTGQYTGQPPYGATVWADQTFSPTDFGNYRVERGGSGVGLYLVSNVNPIGDVREIKLIENGSGAGGLAFIPAESGRNSLYSSQWYATTYTRNIRDQYNKCYNYINTLKSLPSFQQLSAAKLKGYSDSFQDLTNLGFDTGLQKQSLQKCQSLSNILQLDLSAISLAPLPSSPISSDIPNVDLTKFSRVNFSPQDYIQAVSGQPLTTF